jgi:hypothetical protein
MKKQQIYGLLGLASFLLYIWLETKEFIKPKQYHVHKTLFEWIPRPPSNFIKQLKDRIFFRESLGIVLFDKDGNIKLQR